MSRQPTQEYLAEAEELLERLGQDLALLGESIDADEADPDLVNSIFRDAHSLKGLSGMFGFDDIAELSHHLETLLDHFRLGKIALNAILYDALFETVEGLGLLVREKALNPQTRMDISSYVSRIDKLMQSQKDENATSSASLSLDPALLKVLTEYEEHRLQENLNRGSLLLLVHALFELESFDTDLSALTRELKQAGEVISTLPGVSNDNPSCLAFRILFASKVPLENLQAQAGLAPYKFEIVSQARHGMLEPVAPVSPPPMTASQDLPKDKIAPVTQPIADELSLRSLSQTVRVDIGKLNVLMNLVGELGLARGHIAQLATTLTQAGIPQARDLDKAVHVLERRLGELQKAVMDVRMVPVRQLFDKMTRIVRRMAHEMGKKVELATYGADTEFDKLIAEDLADPMMHIIRNALDHGLEPSAERLSLGKPEVGRIEMRATQRGNHVVLEIIDDGRGIDPQVLQAKGIEKGLLNPEAQVSRQDLFALLFHPGFSTRDQVSEYSGRGVGMDVVKNNIAAMSGIIDIESTPGQGTQIALTLPITLAIIKALVVRIQQRDYAIPLTSVLETLLLEPGMIRSIEGQQVMSLRGSTLPLLHLNQIFQFEQTTSTAGEYVVVVGFIDRRIGLIVEALHGQQDVVIKSLGESLSFVQGIAGAADLGNQKTVLVLDIGNLVSATLHKDGGLNV